ncbi:MAG: GH3 auxin-responsive promoter family protein [Bacteroidia bacterium]|nr:GH3 auxin-responsive promoter family protein [Bacteroidia bacterium]
MRSIINSAFRLYLKMRYRQIEEFKMNPVKVQDELLMYLVDNARRTQWGKEHGFSGIYSVKDYRKQPVVDYTLLEPYIKKMMYEEENILVRGKVKWFSKSSGTTSSKSKFIPVPEDNLTDCHIKGTWDTMAMVYHNNSESKIFQQRSLMMGGSLQHLKGTEETYIGDISAIMIKNMPIIGKPFHTPDIDVALMSDWEKKIERMAKIVSEHEDVVAFGGVPTWVVVLFKKILDITGKDHMLDVWPELECYLHGGVGFRPYRDQFKEFIPSDKFNYIEVYNATEGYFAAQEYFGTDDMLLLLDNGIYYEFIPIHQLDYRNPDVLSLQDVEVGKQYALVITTNAGLWRYMPGDTVTFTSTFPFRIQVTGRTKQYVNAFGEEVIIDNTDKAIAETCSELNAQVAEYTMGPRYFGQEAKAAHEWILEFEKEPECLDVFNKILDDNLKRLNSDYEAKREKDMALTRPHIHKVPKDTFQRWLKSKGKLGGQHKVPRLANDRSYLEEILQFAESNR